eukprot:16234-Heterococcus_DN1.PRE.2
MLQRALVSRASAAVAPRTAAHRLTRTRLWTQLQNGQLSHYCKSMATAAGAQQAFPVVDGALDAAEAASAKANQAAMDALVVDLKQRLAKAAAGGGEVACTRHKARGKMLARERIEQLLDAGTPFLELSPLAGGTNMYGKDDVAAGGMVAGIGVVSGVKCVIVANDATHADTSVALHCSSTIDTAQTRTDAHELRTKTALHCAQVKGGTYYPITVKKHLRAQEVAAQNGLPCVYLVDSGGAFLPLQADVFPDRDHFGRIFFNQANMSARGLAQIAVVMGSCTAGGAYVPAMSDESIIVKGTGTVFLAGPPLVMAATGEQVAAEDLGGAEVHCSKSGESPISLCPTITAQRLCNGHCATCSCCCFNSYHCCNIVCSARLCECACAETGATATACAGVADHFAEDDAHALEIARSIMAGLNIPTATAAAATDSSSSGSAAQTAGVSEAVCQEPLFGPDDMGSVIPTDPKRPFDVRKQQYRQLQYHCIGREAVLNRMTFLPGCWQWLCQFFSAFAPRFWTDVSTVHAVTTTCYHCVTGSMRMKALLSTVLRWSWLWLALRLAQSYAHSVSLWPWLAHSDTYGTAVNMHVPKLTCVIGGSYGAGNYGMCGRAYDPRFLYMWPNAKIGVMGAEQAASVLAQVEKVSSYVYCQRTVTVHFKTIAPCTQWSYKHCSSSGLYRDLATGAI